MKTLKFSMLLLVSFGACEQIDVAQMTTPPPGKEGLVDNDADQITLSVGTALAFDCSESVPDYDGPCRVTDLTTADESVAGFHQAATAILQASLNKGPPNGESERPAAVFVVTGNEIGSTHVDIHTSDQHLRFAVEVVP